MRSARRLPPILDPALDLEKHARHAILVGFVLAAFLHGAAVAHALLTPVSAAPPRVPPRQADPVEFEVALSALPVNVIPLVIPVETIEAPARPQMPAPVLVAPPVVAEVPPATPERTPALELEPVPVPTQPMAATVPSVAAPRPPVTPARLGGNVQWRCPWPKEADPEIRHIVVQVLAEVRDDGSPTAIRVVSDPGYGFGRAAQSCAMNHVFVPAQDGLGQKASGATLPFAVRFDRY